MNLENILFLDIETVPQEADFKSLPPEFAELWLKKEEYLSYNEEIQPGDLYARAGIYAEFGKIVCISVGLFKNGQLNVKSYYGHDEAEILKDFAALCRKMGDFFLCAHNGKEFDFPYIARRMVIHQIQIPKVLNIAGLKPWDVKHFDTMELWKFGDRKSFTSLNLLAYVFGIPSPKDDISGADVHKVYWEEQNLERIKVYCEKDVVCLVKIFQRLMGLPMLKEENVQWIKP
jgi:3'-5' exonuclease